MDSVVHHDVSYNWPGCIKLVAASVQTQRFDEVFTQLATLGLSDRRDVNTQSTSLTLSRGQAQL